MTKLVISVLTILSSIFAVTDKALADACGNDGAIGTIRFQACDKVAITTDNFRTLKYSVEEFMVASEQHTSMVVAQHNVVATELIARSLEKNRSAIAQTVLDYKLGDFIAEPIAKVTLPLLLAQR